MIDYEDFRRNWIKRRTNDYGTKINIHDSAR